MTLSAFAELLRHYSCANGPDTLGFGILAGCGYIVSDLRV